MQVSPTSTAILSGSPIERIGLVRVVGAELVPLVAGQIVSVNVLTTTGNRSSVTIDGKTLEIQTENEMQPGDVFQARVRPGNPMTLERIDSQQAVRTSSPLAEAKLLLVDVLSPRPDGRWNVRIDDQQAIASWTAPTISAGRYVLEVVRSAAGIQLSTPADSPNLATNVSAALLRGTPRPEIGRMATELAVETVDNRVDFPEPVRQAAKKVSDLLYEMAPRNRAPVSQELENLVENGGLVYESKLARGAIPEHSQPTSDLKGALLRLIQTAHELGHAANFTATQSAVQAIEASQATNVVSQEQGGPIFLQIPLFDTTGWKTVSLAIERDQPESSGAEQTSRSFRFFLHVPLSQLGETWISAGTANDTFRATLYLDSPTSQTIVRETLASLHSELADLKLGEVAVDVRDSSMIPARFREIGFEMKAGHPASVPLLDAKA